MAPKHMKIDQPKLQSAYLAKIYKICEDCDDKSHFSIPEIVSIIADLIDTGEYRIPLSNSSVLELCATYTKLSPEWSKETVNFVDELFSRLEHAETEVEVFDARLEKQWTIGSNLYTEKEMNNETTKAYNQGYNDGSNHYYGEDCPKNNMNPKLKTLLDLWPQIVAGYHKSCDHIWKFLGEYDTMQGKTYWFLAHDGYCYDKICFGPFDSFFELIEWDGEKLRQKMLEICLDEHTYSNDHERDMMPKHWEQLIEKLENL